MLEVESIAVLLGQGEALAFVEGDNEDAGLRGLDNGDLAERF